MKDDFANLEYKVLDILTPTRLVLNCGTEQELQIGDVFLIYAIGKIMTDPDTQEELERIILPKGKGRVVFVQKRICTIESSLVETKESTPLLFALAPPERVIKPFNGPHRGDRASYVSSATTDDLFTRIQQLGSVKE